jgi:hypothetical protein
VSQEHLPTSGADLPQAGLVASLLVVAVLLWAPACSSTPEAADDDAAQSGTTSTNGAGGAGGSGAGGGEAASAGAPGFPARAYHAGNYDGGETYSVVMSTPSGSSTPLSFGSGFQPGAVAASSDASHLAVAGFDVTRSARVVRVFPMGADGLPDAGAAWDAATLPATHGDASVADLEFSPDGERIGFVSDHLVDQEFRLYIVATSGGTPTPVAPGVYVGSFRWISDDDVFYFDSALYYPCYRADAPDYEPQLLHDMCFPELGHVDAEGRIYFLAQEEGTFYVRRATGAVVEPDPVAGTALTNNVGEAMADGIAVSPDGTRLAFATEAPTFGNLEVFVLDLDETEAVQVSDFSGTSIGAGAMRVLKWHPDGESIVVEGQGGLFVVPATGGSYVQIIEGSYVYAFDFSSDGTLWLQHDVDDVIGLYATADMTSAMQAPSSIDVYVPAAGNVLWFDVVPE